MKKKLILKKEASYKGEVLSREQLKKVLGGSGSGSNDKVEACKGKARYASCVFTYNGTTYSGKCDAYIWGNTYHCSTLI